MPRVTHVKKAQQRYHTVPVLDENGQPKTTPVMRNGQQRTTKRGKPIVMRVTVEDRTRPKPMPKCDASPCRVAADRDGDRTIRVGDAYKHISPKSGPYGGRTLYRHGACPTWQVWEYSSSTSARLAQLDFEARAELDEDDADSVRAALETAASLARDLASEKEEGASNIEDGFGHETEQSSALRQFAEDLETWADELEQAASDLEDRPDEEEECGECGGTGTVAAAADHAPTDAAEVDCPECDGSGQVESDDLATWQDSVQDALAKLDEVPDYQG